MAEILGIAGFAPAGQQLSRIRSCVGLAGQAPDIRAGCQPGRAPAAVAVGVFFEVEALSLVGFVLWFVGWFGFGVDRNQLLNFVLDFVKWNRVSAFLKGATRLGNIMMICKFNGRPLLKCLSGAFVRCSGLFHFCFVFQTVTHQPRSFYILIPALPSGFHPSHHLR